MPTDAVAHELFLRHLDSWVPAALRRARRATVVLGYDGGDPRLAEETLRLAGEHATRLRGGRLTVLVLADGTEELPARLGTAEAGLPADVAVHLMPGDASRLPVALRAAGAAGAPVLSYLEVDGPVNLAALTAAAATGRPAEALVVAGAGTPLRPALADAGFPLTTDVELVDVDRRIGFGTGSDRSLEAIKESVWAAGLRCRDPQGLPLSPGPEVDPQPLGRALLDELTRHGPRTVTELRRFAVTGTAYRAVDAARALAALLDAGAVTRSPEHGRLGGDVLVTPARST
ncbi:hypothetical protein SAMN05443287_101510 [Micromonospora phaseoli]|uniref:Uncharacterized protein n=1 Tax=Micromonospora phaseoli TaxID=1144548 RepID=A0A1H6SDH8_9ACTN|nr:hypothetical protein [Micromonospora phaseoli]PZW03760.1 hypothetical protein CLV64_101510 [Micromonospora phaseoli]GIJ79054.1 hypothetical protein Xph01_34860 [Micromonospora phaseoli]SEI61815.1 hypothetical protein SAMN05443287_101510 [Micromonospora phaseoli]